MDTKDDAAEDQENRMVGVIYPRNPLKLILAAQLGEQAFDQLLTSAIKDGFQLGRKKTPAIVMKGCWKPMHGRMPEKNSIHLLILDPETCQSIQALDHPKSQQWDYQTRNNPAIKHSPVIKAWYNGQPVVRVNVESAFHVSHPKFPEGAELAGLVRADELLPGMLVLVSTKMMGFNNHGKYGNSFYTKGILALGISAMDMSGYAQVVGEGGPAKEIDWV